MQPFAKVIQNDYHFTYHRIWSSLASDFRSFEEKILHALFYEPQEFAQGVQDYFEQKSLVLKEKVRKQVSSFEESMKKRLFKILYQCSVNQYQCQTMKRKVLSLQTRMSQERGIHEGEVKKWQQKMKDLEKLVKIYEKSLSHAKKQQREPQENLLNQKYIKPQLWKESVHKVREGRAVVMKMDRIYSIKIQGQERINSVRGSNLSYSRLTSSRVSNSGIQRAGLKQLESNWNKSVNLSSKSLKSGVRQQRMIRKQGRQFIKSQIRQKQMKMQCIKESSNKRRGKKKIKDELNQLMVSQFSLGK